jgi:DNA gyrase subunit A
MSSTGLVARTSDTQLASDPEATRAKHDVITSYAPATTRGHIGLVTSTGRVIRMSVLDIPSLPAVNGTPALSAGAPLGAFIDLPKGESVLCLTPLDSGIALATRSGVIKRVQPDALSNKDSWDIIRLDDKDVVIGATALDEATAESAELVIITAQAQLLHFPASAVRPQGRAAAGMAGIKLGAGDEVLGFSVINDPTQACVVTIAGSTSALPGTDAGSIKVTAFAEYPAKGRATAGVRCHKLRSGEDALIGAWAVSAPPRAATASGVAVELPAIDDRRDGTGTAGTAPIAGVGGSI